MSVLKHATISAWQRAEDGSYEADLHGWQLRVRWVPERPGERRGFLWEATSPSGAKRASHEVHEEIEVAMAEAEEHVAPDPSMHEGKTVG